MSRDQKKLFFTCVRSYNRTGNMPNRESIESTHRDALTSCLEKTANEKEGTKRQRGRGRQNKNDGNRLRRSAGQDSEDTLPPLPVPDIPAAWHVVREHQMSNSVRGPDVDSEWRTHRIVDAVSVIEHPTQGPLLLLARHVGLDYNLRQHESLFNSHHMRDSGIQVDDRFFRHNGTQSVMLDDIQVMARSGVCIHCMCSH